MCCCTIHAADGDWDRSTSQLAALVADDTSAAYDVDCNPKKRLVENSKTKQIMKNMIHTGNKNNLPMSHKTLDLVQMSHLPVLFELVQTCWNIAHLQRN